MAIEHEFDLGRVATDIVSVFPTLGSFEQRLSFELYRLLAEGQPVPRALLAERLSVPVEVVNHVLNEWPGVFSDPQQRVVGYWGLSIPGAYMSPHCLTIGGRRLSAWCAWDTLFLPQLLGQRAEVESASPTPNVTISLTVTPEEVERVEPVGARMSFLLPDIAAGQKDIVTAFCRFVHFFSSSQAAKAWAVQHPGSFTLTVGEAHALGRRKNEAQYGKLLE